VTGSRYPVGVFTLVLAHVPVASPGHAGRPDDVAAVYLAARRQLMPYAPLAHDDEAVQHWITAVLIPDSDVIPVVLYECNPG